MANTKADTKGERIYIRVAEKIRDEFDIVAEHRGLSRSALLHSLIVKTIFDTKKEVPEIFENVSTGSDVERNSNTKKSDTPTMTLDEAKADDARKKGKKK